MIISTFDDLLQAARTQDLPQRLLLVFANAELPPDCTPQQRQQFEAGTGGALVPGLCVDKTPEELGNFAALREESAQFAVDWQMVFVSTLTGTSGQAPTSQQADTALTRMVTSIKLGALANMIVFDRQGEAISLS
ncbi:ribonucleotide reductase subunit alpha [Rhodoferax sp.]|uniref:ribonucleotide reductase subunit alpha n=1 Tax=Rhodoferax sp. TaxID=50421 RepID=UPI00262F5C6D|nr:ribonucleotide reductase subunit alpha [Rhodoferax sp.]MDD2924992.1 ribonucleotide reductase subunit alpha [Rhodoferax sp.]